MINAQELRLGNLLTDFKGQTVEVVSIDKNLVITKPCGSPFHINSVLQTGNTVEEIMPIELTEEWLLKFGGTIDYDGDINFQFGRKYFQVSKTDQDHYLLLYSNDIGLPREVLRFVEYIHEIQNTIHSISGEELQLSQNTQPIKSIFHKHNTHQIIHIPNTTSQQNPITFQFF